MNAYTPIFPTTYGQGFNGYNQQPASQQLQRPVMQPQAMGNYICRPVASEEEARAFPTDFTGATLVLVDAAHNRIYTKALNMFDGSALFTVFQGPEQAPPAAAPVPEYVPMSEFQALRKELEQLKASITKKREDLTDD